MQNKNKNAAKRQTPKQTEVTAAKRVAKLIITTNHSTEYRRVIHVAKEYGDWKSSGFILALENIRAGIMAGDLRTIEKCCENENFPYCSVADQEQLIDIANWYLHEAEYI